MRVSLIWISCVLMAWVSSVSSVSAQTLSMPQIQERAVQNAFYVQALARESLSEQEKIGAVSLYPNPSIYTQFGHMDSAGMGVKTWDVTVNQVIPFPGKLGARKKIQTFQTELAQADQTMARILIQHESTLTAVKLLVLNEIAKHTQERQRRYALIHAYLKSHPLISPAQKTEGALIENQIRLLEKGIIELNQNQKVAQIELKSFLRTQEHIEPQMPWIQKVHLPSLDELRKVLFQKSPIWLKKEFEVKKAQEFLRKSELEPFPDFTLGLNYRIEKVGPPNLFWSGALGISIPLWDHGQYSIPAARLQLEAENDRRTGLEIELERRLLSLYEQTQSSAKVLDVLPISIAQDSEVVFRQAEEGFRKRRVDASLFVQTDLQLHETIDSVYYAQLKFLEDLSQLLRLVGRNLEWE